MADLAHEELGKWQREAEERLGYGLTAVVCEGVPWVAIARQAEESQVDLVVVGTQGRTGLDHALIGSVAERVVRHSTKPVLVVKAERP
jgi:nucleotide-binding universal stress UspA family protein